MSTTTQPHDHLPDRIPNPKNGFSAPLRSVLSSGKAWFDQSIFATRWFRLPVGGITLIWALLHSSEAWAFAVRSMTEPSCSFAWIAIPFVGAAAIKVLVAESGDFAGEVKEAAVIAFEWDCEEIDRKSETISHSGR